MNQDKTDDMILRQMYNDSRDIIAVYNPTLQDYILKFDSRKYLIPSSTRDEGHGKGIAHVYRHLGEKYMSEMCDRLICLKRDDLVAKENEKRAAKGQDPLDKGELGALRVEGSILVHDLQHRMPIMKKLYKGLVQKSPEDFLMKELDNAPDPTKTVDQSIFSQLNDIIFTPESPDDVFVDATEPDVEAPTKPRGRPAKVS